MQNFKTLLSTRPLPKAIVEEAAAKGIAIEELSFIETFPVLDEVIINQIKTVAAQEAVVVFTSMNAVEAVAAQTTTVNNWKVYCIGNTTKQLVMEKLAGATIMASAENAKALAERLVDDGIKNATFFCGNIRRDELPNKLRSEGGKVDEIIVYHTEERPSHLTKEYDGILFFSPSAVDSFFTSNKVPKQTELFAIGKTTAEAIRQHLNKKIFIAHATDKVELTRFAIDYFVGQENSI